MHAVPVLMITHDDTLWRHWRDLDAQEWLPARGKTLADLDRWREQGRTLVVLDSSLPRLPDWAEPSWEQRLKGLKVVVASTSPDDNEARQAVSAGASGYAHAYSPAAAWNRILRNVEAGDLWLGRSLLTRLLQEIDRRLPSGGAWDQPLSAREKEVAWRAAIGDSNQDIAITLGISERTVRAHMSSIFDKLGVHDRLMLALKVHGIS